MGRAPCCDKAKVKRGPWSPEEDATLKSYLHSHGTGGNWIALPAKAGLKRCGKSCRLRWLNYLRPDIKHGGFTAEEDLIICTYHSQIGSRWSVIASQLPGRTDNDVKNYWNTKLKKKLLAGNINNLNNNNNNNNSSRAVGDSVGSMLTNYSSSSSSSSPLLSSCVVPKNEPFFISPAAATTDEHIHFSSWYGLNSLPDYSNNYHSDLYRPVLPPSDHIVPPQIEAIGISREDTVNVVSQEGSCISSDSSSLPVLPIDQDFGFGAFSYDIWYPNMADLALNNSYVDIKTQELLDRSHHQVTNQY